ncbi:MAG: sigma-70 family RNA polymerase sigma factor [Phycisphaera sp. RhM]|nr:sigma-70 family RNA polymerase sigma factor [Phycisphaera sp. RhM]
MSIATNDCQHSTGESNRSESDAALLREFAASRNDLVFAQLVTRHAGLVMGVCRRALGNEQDAEDAFQATFLVLSRKAGSLRKGKSLPGWLHKTAFRIALRARATKARRREKTLESEVMAEDSHFLNNFATEHGRSTLDEELNRLPERYRLPLILCCLEGKSRDQAAEQLGWSVGSLKGRLERARQVLRRRLVLRGVSLAVIAVLLNPHQAVAREPVDPSLVVSTVQAGVRFAAGGSPVGYVSSHSYSLANWNLKAMTIFGLKGIAGTLLLLGTLTLGNFLFSIPAPANAGDDPIILIATTESTGPATTLVALFADEQEDGNREREERERAKEREERERGPGAELRQRLEELNRRLNELRESRQLDQAAIVERQVIELRQRLERIDNERPASLAQLRERFEVLDRCLNEHREARRLDQAAEVEREFIALRERIARAERQQRELPAELRERVERLKRRHAELREAGKADEAEAVEREVNQLLERYRASRQGEGERHESEAAKRLRHLRSAVENLRAAGLNDLAAQAAEQVGRLEREVRQQREVENREHAESEARERETRERR